MGLKVGVAAVLSRNSGTFGTPTWANVNIIRDVSIPHSADEGDASCRVSAYHLAEPTMKSLSFEFNLLHDHTNAEFVAIRNAWLNKTTLDLVASDDAIATVGTLGMRMECKVFDFSEDQTLDGVVVNKVVCKPCYPTSGVGPVAWTSS